MLSRHVNSALTDPKLHVRMSGPAHDQRVPAGNLSKSLAHPLTLSSTPRESENIECPMPSSNGSHYNASLSSWFDQAVKTVRAEAEYLESKIFVPFWKTYFAFWKKNPFTTMLLTTFAIVGFLPVLSFFAFGVLILSSFTFVALVSVASVAAWVLSAAAFILATTLGFSFAFCSFLSSSAYLGFLQYRLLAHVLDSAKHGGVRFAIYRWAQETYFRLGLPQSLSKPLSSTPTTAAAPSYEESLFAEELKVAERWKAAHGD